MVLEGERLGSYHLVRLLGSGGMGEVYLAEDIRIGQQVAIKVIRTEGLASPESESVQEAARLFEREAKAIARLDHPHILPLYAYGEETLREQLFTYLVMPYRKEGTLTHWLRQRGSATLTTPAEVAPLVQQAAAALQHAHDRQVIHQDVKPTNFLVRQRNEQPDRPDLLLADFGIAKLTSATANTSQSVRGTPTYMAPEQWDGHPVPATDQYSLAIMVYELLVGHPPFQGGPGQVMRQHYQTPPPAPSSLNPHLSPALDAVLLRALAKQPEERFPSMLAFAHAFQEAAQRNGEQAAESPPSVSELSREPTGSVRGEKGIAPTMLAALTPRAPVEMTTPAGHTSPRAAMAPSATSPVVRPEAMGAAKPGKRRTFQRMVLGGLGGLVMVALASGIVWFTTHRASPAGIVTQFTLPTPGSQLRGITAGPDGNLWFTEIDGKVVGSQVEFMSSKIGRITPSGQISEFSLPAANRVPTGITTGSDGNLWFTEPGGNRIGRITPSGQISEFSLPIANSSPEGITAGPDGNLWFGEFNRVGRISPSGHITEFPLPPANDSADIGSLTAGPDGSLWFVESGTNKIGRISSTGRITEFPLLTATSRGFPDAITAGPDGNLWFTELIGQVIGNQLKLNGTYKIGRISPNGSITEFPLPRVPLDVGVGAITTGPDGNLWFGESSAEYAEKGAIMRITSGK